MADFDTEQPGGRVKGAAFREMVRWTEVNYGSEPVLRGYNRLSPEQQELLDPNVPAMGIVSSYWYPMEVATKLTDPMVENVSESERQRLIRESTRYSLDRTFRGIHRMLFKLMVDPPRAARHVQRLWELHYDSGQVRWEIVDSGRMHATVSQWASHTRNACEMLRHTEIYLFEVMGCKDVEATRTQCVSLGDEYCASVVTWTP